MKFLKLTREIFPRLTYSKSLVSLKLNFKVPTAGKCPNRYFFLVAAVIKTILYRDIEKEKPTDNRKGLIETNSVRGMCCNRGNNRLENDWAVSAIRESFTKFKVSKFLPKFLVTTT